MTDFWDVARYVEDHPDNYKQRWRLAKKLYQAQEYRLALEHLQILKNEWMPKVNVLRFLAATYFRLKRYTEAIAELEKAIETWPEEVGLREQLAQALEMSGQRLDAARVWEGTLELMPNHPTARGAAARLRAETGASEPEPVPAGQDSVLMMATGQTCPNCGADNPDAFKRCWQCGATLAPATPLPTERAKAGGVREAGPFPWTLLGGLVTVVLMSMGVFLTLKHLALASQQAEGLMTVCSVDGLLAVRLVLARIVAGAAMLVGWPIALWVGLSLVRAEHSSGMRGTISGLLLAALAYLVLWAPVGLMPFAPLVPAAASLFLVLLVFRLELGQALLVWVVQGLLVLFLGAGAFLTIEGPAPFQQFAAISRYAAHHDAEAPAMFALPPVQTPVALAIQWESTGSPWLDKKARQVELRIRSKGDAAPVTVELRRDSQTVVYQRLGSNPSKLTVDIEAGQAYQLVLGGEEGVEVEVTIFGVLTPNLGP